MTARCIIRDDGKYTWQSHEHWCSSCNKWWRCSDKKCVKVPVTPCHKHKDKQ